MMYGADIGYTDVKNRTLYISCLPTDHLSSIYLCLYRSNSLSAIDGLIASTSTVSIHMYVYAHTRKAKTIELELGYTNTESSLCCDW